MKRIVMLQILITFLMFGSFLMGKHEAIKTESEVTLKIDLEDQSELDNSLIPDEIDFPKMDLVLKIIGNKNTPNEKLEIKVNDLEYNDVNSLLKDNAYEWHIRINGFYIVREDNTKEKKEAIDIITSPWTLIISLKYKGNTLINEKKIKNIASTAQYPVYDAIELANTQSKAEKFKILIFRYAGNEDLAKNPILSELLQLKKYATNFVISKDEPINEQEEKIVINALLPPKSKSEFHPTSTPTPQPLSGFTIPTFVGALAQFLVERVKEELAINFFRAFQNEIGNPKYESLQVIFPETYMALNAIDKEIYNFQTFLDQLREAFDKDLSNIYSHVYALLIKNDELLKNKKWLKSILLSSFYLIDSLSKEKNPGEILEGLSPDEIFDNSDSSASHNIKNSIKLLQLISFSLREKKIPNDASQRYWIKKDKLVELFKKTGDEYLAFKYYLGLLYQQAMGKEITFKKPSKQDVILLNVLKELTPIPDKIERAQVMIKNFTAEIDLLEKFLIDARGGIKIKYEDIYTYFNAFLNTIDYTADLYNFIISEFAKPEGGYNFEADTGIDKYLSVARCLGEIYLDINKRNYSSAIFNVVSIFDKIFVVAADEKMKDLMEQKKSLENEIQSLEEAIRKKPDDGEIVKNLKCKKEHLTNIKKDITFIKNFSKARDLIFKYGAFMAAVAKAENSDQVKAAIESVVLPAGGSAIKKSSKCNIALNAYVGLFLGHENQKELKDRCINITGVCAPIGLAISKGLGFNTKHKTSLSLFLPIIDIGAVAAYKFIGKGETDAAGNEDKSEALPEFKLENIFAPGAYIVLGFANVPISIGGGVQYGPQLRKITKADTAVITTKAFRFSVFLAVDIPLINFYTKPQQY